LRTLAPRTQAVARPFRAATWNLQSCCRGLPDIVRVLRSLDADLVGLQEIDRGTRRAGRIDQVGELAHQAGFRHHHFFRAMCIDSGEYGLGLLCRWPLAETRVVELPSAPGLEPRILASATVDLPQAPLGVYVTHLTHVDKRSGLRAAQARAIALRVAENDGPRLLLGDFNSLPGSRAHRLLRRSLRDVFREVGRGRGGTFPLLSVLPAMRIDYAFASAQLELTGAAVVRTAASDHYPLVAEVSVPPGEALCARAG